MLNKLRRKSLRRGLDSPKKQEQIVVISLTRGPVEINALSFSKSYLIQIHLVLPVKGSIRIGCLILLKEMVLMNLHSSLAKREERVIEKGA